MGNILRMYFAWWFGGLGPKSNFYFNLSNRFVLKADQRRNTCNVPRKCFAWFRGLGLLNPVSFLIYQPTTSNWEVRRVCGFFLFWKCAEEKKYQTIKSVTWKLKVVSTRKQVLLHSPTCLVNEFLFFSEEKIFLKIFKFIFLKNLQL